MKWIVVCVVVWIAVFLAVAAVAQPLDMIHPLGWQGEQSSGQGLRQNPLGGSRWMWHNGEDWRALMGTPVFAVARGIVIEVYEPDPGHPFYGGMVRLQHDDGSTTLYAHLSRVDVWLDWVCWQGREIGAVGNTGQSTGPHLHFERTVPVEFLPPPPPVDTVQRAIDRMMLYYQSRAQEERNVVP